MARKLKTVVDPDAAMLAAGPPDEATATPEETALWGRLVGQKLNAIEGNPLDAEQVAMFKRFERDGTSHEDARAEIAKRGRLRAQGLL
jgi:hypothetical protein